MAKIAGSRKAEVTAEDRPLEASPHYHDVLATAETLARSLAHLQEAAQLADEIKRQGEHLGALYARVRDWQGECPVRLRGLGEQLGLVVGKLYDDTAGVLRHGLRSLADEITTIDLSATPEDALPTF